MISNNSQNDSKIQIEVFSLNNSQFNSPNLEFLNTSDNIEKQTDTFLDNTYSSIDTPVSEAGFNETPDDVINSKEIGSFTSDFDQIFAEFDQEVSKIFPTSNSEDLLSDHNPQNTAQAHFLSADDVLNSYKKDIELPLEEISVFTNTQSLEEELSIEHEEELLEEHDLVEETKELPMMLEEEVEEELSIEHEEKLLEEHDLVEETKELPMMLEEEVEEELSIEHEEKLLEEHDLVEETKELPMMLEEEVEDSISIQDIVLNDISEEDYTLIHDIILSDETELDPIYEKQDSSGITNDFLKELNSNIPLSSSNITTLSKQDVQILMKEIDNLLEYLPEDKIEELSQKDFYHLYLKFLDDLGI